MDRISEIILGAIIIVNAGLIYIGILFIMFPELGKRFLNWSKR